MTGREGGGLSSAYSIPPCSRLQVIHPPLFVPHAPHHRMPAAEVRVIPGHGVVGRVGACHVAVGSARLAREVLHGAQPAQLAAAGAGVAVAVAAGRAPCCAAKACCAAAPAEKKPCCAGPQAATAGCGAASETKGAGRAKGGCAGAPPGNVATVSAPKGCCSGRTGCQKSSQGSKEGTSSACSASSCCAAQPTAAHSAPSQTGATAASKATPKEAPSPSATSPPLVTASESAIAAAVTAWAAKGGATLCFVVVDGALAGVLAARDSPRPHAGEAVAQLQAEGVTCAMLTGGFTRDQLGGAFGCSCVMLFGSVVLGCLILLATCPSPRAAALLTSCCTCCFPAAPQATWLSQPRAWRRSWAWPQATCTLSCCQQTSWPWWAHTRGQLMGGACGEPAVA